MAGAVEQGYGFSNAWEHARRRLDLLEGAYDADSHRRLAEAGVGAGARCLEAGAGGGSIARWLAERVGPEGRVVALDADTSLLGPLAEVPNVEVRRADLVAGEIEAGAYDLVHTRMVLFHIPARDAVLERLVAALRPGGVLVLEEQESFSIAANPPGDFRAAFEAFAAGNRAIGVDPGWAHTIPARLVELGLEDVAAEIDVPLFRGGSVEAEFWRLSWLQLRDRVTATGVAGEVIDRGRTALTDPAQWFYGPAMVVVRARRPGA